GAPSPPARKSSRPTSSARYSPGSCPGRASATSPPACAPAASPPPPASPCTRSRCGACSPPPGTPGSCLTVPRRGACGRGAAGDGAGTGGGGAGGEAGETAAALSGGRAFALAPGHTARRYLLSGIARCGPCGGPVQVLTGYVKPSGEKIATRYGCLAPGCRKVFRNLEHLDTYVIVRTVAKLGDKRNPPRRVPSVPGLPP